MQLELRDISGYTFRCDTRDMKIMALWLESWIQQIAESNVKYHAPWQIQVWFSDQTEAAYFDPNNKMARPSFVNSEKMRDLAAAFTEAAKRMERVEKRGKL